MKHLKTFLATSWLLGVALAGHAQYFSDGTFNYEVLFDDETTCKITGFSSYMDAVGDIVIPSSVEDYGDNYTVVAIGDEAFQNLSEVTSFLLPESLQTIGEAAFSGCSGLISIEIPDNVRTLGYMSFSECSNVETIIIGKSVNEIDDYAFAFLNSLKAITCHAPVPPQIGEDTFDWNLNKSSVILTVPEGSLESYANSDWEGFDIQEEAAEAPYAESVEIEGVIYGNFSTEAPYTCAVTGHIENFSATGFTIYSSVEANGLKYDVKTIEGSAFKGVKTVSGMVVIEDGIENIGEDAFNGFSVRGITLPSTLLTLGERAFFGCMQLEEINIPGSLTNIPAKAFERDKKLESVTVGEGVVTLGSSCFRGCESLKEIELPSSLETISSSVFEECESLPDINIPATVKEIGPNAFYYCSSLKKIELPEAITEIPAGFLAYSGVTEFTIPSGVTAIGPNAFEYCMGLQEIEVPSGVTIIGKDAFSNCESMTKISLNEGIGTIGENAFYECISVADIEIPESVTSVEVNAFTGCSSLESATVNAGVIEKNAFMRCSRLKDLCLGKNVKNIGDGAFSESNIESIEVLATEPPALETSAFNQATYTEARLTVPENCIETYHNAEGWRNFTAITTGANEIREYKKSFHLLGNTIIADGTTSVSVFDASGKLMLEKDMEACDTVTVPGEGFRVVSDGTYSIVTL